MTKFLSQLGLQVLKVVVEAGSFSTAAQLLYISQPAVSGHIQRIEQELGIKLFQKNTGNKLFLTDAGRIVYNYAVDILTKNNELEERLEELKHGESGQVKFAFSVSKNVFASLISEFRVQMPKVSFVLRTGNSFKIQQFIMNNDVDFGVSLRSYNDQLKYIPFYTEPIVAVCSPSHPLVSKRVIYEKNLNKYGIISGLQGSEYDFFCRNYLTQLGIDYHNVMIQVEDPLIALRIVERGGGVGFMLLSSVNEALKKGNLVRLSFKYTNSYPLIAYLVFRQEAKYNAATSLFIKFLKNKISELFPFISLLE